MPSPEPSTPEGIVEVIAGIFARRGSAAYLGERLTMAEHMLQAAAQAEREGAAPELVAAALLHDVGHFTLERGEELLLEGTNNRHEDAGASFLEGFFPAATVEPIRLHVAAKRYLCATDVRYAAQLTDASRYTLSLQGGAMSAEEVAAFERRPHFEASLRLRRWDEAAKTPARDGAGFDAYRPLLLSLVRRHDVTRRAPQRFDPEVRSA